jgi:hypothetical protein
MCSLCGSLGGPEHWAVAVPDREASAAGRTRRAERLAHARIANGVLRLFSLHLDDWQGSAFVLTSATGKREVVDSLPAVWLAAAAMLGRPIDPLDLDLIDRLTGRPR